MKWSHTLVRLLWHDTIKWFESKCFFLLFGKKLNDAFVVFIFLPSKFCKNSNCTYSLNMSYFLACLVLLVCVADGSPGRHGSAPDTSRSGEEAWPCPRFDLPARRAAAGNWRAAEWRIRVCAVGNRYWKMPDGPFPAFAFTWPHLATLQPLTPETVETALAAHRSKNSAILLPDCAPENSANWCMQPSLHTVHTGSRCVL